MAENENISAKKKDRFGCILYIDTGDDDPTIIDREIGVRATEYQIKGEAKFNKRKQQPIPNVFYEYNLWIYKTEQLLSDNNLYLNEAIGRMLDYLDYNKDSFYMLFRKYPKNKISCFAYFNDFNPYFLLEKQLTERLNYYQINVEFDLYFLPE